MKVWNYGTVFVPCCTVLKHTWRNDTKLRYGISVLPLCEFLSTNLWVGKLFVGEPFYIIFVDKSGDKRNTLIYGYQYLSICCGKVL